LGVGPSDTLAMFRHRHPNLTLAGGPPEGRKVETTSQPPVKLPSWPRARTVRGARAILQTFIIFPLMGAFSPLTVIDRYRVKTIKGGAIFVSNHSSALDAVVMLQALPSRFRFRAFVVAAADSIFKRKWEAMLTELLINTFPIPRAGGARPALDRLKEHLSHGWSVVIFPEGTLSRTGNIGTFSARVEQAVRTLAGPKGLLRDSAPPAGSAEGSNYWY